jgi:hypothetical protein
MTLYNNLDQVKMIILVIARLHNFVIDECLASGDGCCREVREIRCCIGNAPLYDFERSAIIA